MARIITGRVEQDDLVEEALMENEARNEINRRQRIESLNRMMSKPKIFRIAYVVKVYIRYEIFKIKVTIRKLLQQ